MNGHRSIGRLLLIVPLLAAALAFGSARPAEAAFVCDTYYGDQTITTSVVVPDGAECTLEDVVVRGGVTVGAGAGLDAEFTEIRGSVSGSGVAYVDLDYVTVRGNVSVAGASDKVQVGIVSEVRGNVAISGVANYATVGTASVSGSVTLSNFAPGAEAYIDGPTIRVNLVCSGVPAGVYGVASASVGNRVILTNCPDNGSL